MRFTVGNDENRGEQYRCHHHGGCDLAVPFAEEAVKNPYTLWGRPVHMETQVEDEGLLLLSYGPDGTARRKLD